MVPQDGRAIRPLRSSGAVWISTAADRLRVAARHVDLSAIGSTPPAELMYAARTARSTVSRTVGWADLVVTCLLGNILGLFFRGSFSTSKS